MRTFQLIDLSVNAVWAALRSEHDFGLQVHLLLNIYNRIGINSQIHILYI